MNDRATEVRRAFEDAECNGSMSTKKHCDIYCNQVMLTINTCGIIPEYLSEIAVGMSVSVNTTREIYGY